MEYLRFNVRNKETGAIEEKIVPKDEIYTEEYEKAFEVFHANQPDADTNLRAMYLYRSIVDEFSLEQLKSVPPYIVADYARYQILREEFFDRSREKVCPYCEETRALFLPKRERSLHKTMPISPSSMSAIMRLKPSRSNVVPLMPSSIYSSNTTKPRSLAYS